MENNIKYREYSPLVLAYMGDAVFEILVRKYIVSLGNAPVNELNKKSRAIVNAGNQAKLYLLLENYVTEEEMAVMKRGRNAKSFTKAKNQSVTDYRHATGVEALFGYLYLKGDEERIKELFDICLKGEENEK